MAENKPIIAKIKRTLHNALDAWWVLLIIVGYSVFAWRFLGTSCLFASISGFPCPGCGGTRAFLVLLGGDVAGSMLYHPLLIPALVVAFVYVILWLARDKMPRFMDKILIILTIFLIGVYAVRMMLMFPRQVPMIYNYHAIVPRVIGLFT